MSVCDGGGSADRVAGWAGRAGGGRRALLKQEAAEGRVVMVVGLGRSDWLQQKRTERQR
jgi:hypothetical protein